jgi:ABC-type amino acid transport substrate-binding protein
LRGEGIASATHRHTPTPPQATAKESTALIRAILTAVVLLAAVGTAQAQSDSPIGYPFPQGHLRTGPEVTFCLDKRNPTWKVQQAIAREIAWQMGRPAEFHVHKEAPDDPTRFHPASTRQEFLVLLANYCDAYMGLPGSTTAAFDYPADEEMLASRPYYRASFVLVSRDPAVDTLADFGTADTVGFQGRGVPYMLAVKMRPDQFAIERFQSSAALADALKTGAVDHGVVYGPTLFDRVPKPDKHGLHVQPVTSLPNMDWFVFAGLRSDRPTLRQKVDEAIVALLQRGRIGQILDEHGWPSDVFRPAEIDAKLPDDDFGDEDGGDKDGGQ